MNRFLLIFALPWIASCGEPKVETRLIVPDVPASLRQPVEVTPREVKTFEDVGLVVADYAEAVDQQNGQIKAIDCILRGAEAKAGKKVKPCKVIEK